MHALSYLECYLNFAKIYANLIIKSLLTKTCKLKKIQFMDRPKNQIILGIFRSFRPMSFWLKFGPPRIFWSKIRSSLYFFGRKFVLPCMFASIFCPVQFPIIFVHYLSTVSERLCTNVHDPDNETRGGISKDLLFLSPPSLSATSQ